MKSPRFSARSRRSSQGGFTLMEMIIVLTIIALLVALAMGQLSGFGGIAKRQTAAANVSTFKTALYAYQLDNGVLPTSNQGLKALWAKPTAEPVPPHWHALSESDSIALDPWGHPYQYLCPGKHNPGTFDVWSMGDDGVNSDDDIGNWKATSTGSTP